MAETPVLQSVQRKKAPPPYLEYASGAFFLCTLRITVVLTIFPQSLLSDPGSTAITQKVKSLALGFYFAEVMESPQAFLWKFELLLSHSWFSKMNQSIFLERSLTVI